MISRGAPALVVLAVAGSACGGTPARRDARPPAARALFMTAGCGHCHALEDAHARGGIGPDFDTSERLDRTQLLRAMVEGANGMPSYARRLTGAQRNALADYLLRVAWGRRR